LDPTITEAVDVPAVWIATPQGAVSAFLHEESGITPSTICDISNSAIPSNNILSAVVGRNQLNLISKWMKLKKPCQDLYHMEF
jgi:hypothetical protein